MGESPKTVLEAKGPKGQVCVEFQKVDDYITHEISLLIDDERILVFKSIENPSLPNLPCFTELHQQGKNLFLTGANGPCHWSMSVEVGIWKSDDTDNDDPPKQMYCFEDRYGLNSPWSMRFDTEREFLFFDVACRLKENMIKVSSSYVKSRQFDCPDTGDHFYFVRNNSNPGNLLMFAGASPNHLICNPKPLCMVAPDSAEKLSFRAFDAPIKKYPATVQWSYGIWPM